MTEPNAPTAPRCATRTMTVLAMAVLAMAAVLAVAAVWALFSRSSAPILFEQGLTAAAADPAKGEALLKSAIALSRDRYFPDADIALCRLLVQRRARSEAETRLATIDLASCRPDLLLAFGQAALAADYTAEAEKALETLAASDHPARVSALELLLNHYLEWGQDDKLIATAWRLARSAPDNPRHWNTLVDVLARMSRHAECVEAIREARRHDLPQETHRELRNVLVEALINLGEIPEIERELAEMRKSEPDSVRVRGHQIYLYRLQGKLEQALETIETIMEDRASPSFSRSPQEFQSHAYFTRGILFLDLRRFEEAARDLRRAVDAQPLNSAAKYKLAEAYRALGRAELAREQRDEASRIADKRKRIAELLKQRQDDPRNPEPYGELARLHQELGDPAAAARWREWSQRVGPSR